MLYLCMLFQNTLRRFIQIEVWINKYFKQIRDNAGIALNGHYVYF